MLPLEEEVNRQVVRDELAEATEKCRQTLQIHPRNLAALRLFEGICRKWIARGRYDQAAACFELMLAHCPDSADVHFNLAATLVRMGQHRRAAESLKNAVRLRPDWVEAHYHLGIALEEARDLSSAVEQWRRLVEMKPDHGSALFRLGAVLDQLGDGAGAGDCRARARRAPASPMLCNDLGLVTLREGRLEEAVADFTEAVRLDPNFAEGWMNLGIAQMRAGKVGESGSWLKRAITIEPGRAEARWHYAAALLAAGEYAQGWREYEWRMTCPEFAGKVRAINRPAWRGEEISGRTILLHDEQGYGDTIQFIRYAPLLAGRGATVVVLCRKPMAGLLSRVEGVSRILFDGQPCPRVDVHAATGSLPLLFGTRLESIPGNVPYVTADPELVASWDRKLPPRNGRIRVGLAWRGNDKPNPDRSIPVHFLPPLTAGEGFAFHSLQKRMDGLEIEPPPGMPVQDHATEIGDFSDTAALIANMDWIVSIDTAAAHLAGAMGKPVWTLLPYAADWRWLLNRADSPWYPTMRLLRQSRPGDWAEVIARAVEELRIRQANR